MNKPTTRAVIAAALLGNAASAWADTAEAAFKRAKAALQGGHVHEACQAFQESDKLDPRVETELNLADCYAQDGKLMTAARLYRSLADKDSNPDRRKTSSDKAAKLEAKAPKLRLVLSQRPDGLVIKVDGAEVPTTGDVRVDAGPHEVVATAPGFEGHASAAVDRDRAIVDVIVRMEPAAELTTPNPPPTPAPTPMPAPTPTAAPAERSMQPPPSEPELADHRTRNGVIIGAVGLGVLVGAVVLLEASSSKFDDEHALCPNFTCASAGDVMKANALQSDGRTYRGLSIGMGIGGVAIVGLGAYLLLTPHEEASHVSLSVGHGGGGLAYSGRF